MFLLNQNKEKLTSKLFPENSTEIDFAVFFHKINASDLFTVSKNNIANDKEQFTNLEYTNAYSTYHAYIVDDRDYETLIRRSGIQKVSRYHMINLKSGDQDKIFAGLLQVLRKANHADDTVWEKKSFFWENLRTKELYWRFTNRYQRKKKLV